MQANLDDLFARVSEFKDASWQRHETALTLTSDAEALMALEEEGSLRRQHLDRACSRLDAAEYWLSKAYFAFQEAENQLRHVVEGPNAE